MADCILTHKIEQEIRAEERERVLALVKAIRQEWDDAPNSTAATVLDRLLAALPAASEKEEP